MPVVSIIVPIYNADKFLDKCIKSVLSQTFNDFELLLVNDGSTDSSKKICEKYGRIDTRIKIISQDNGGVTSARKKGWENSSGEWIIFIDADDVAHKNCLKILHNNAVTNYCQIVNAAFRPIPGEKSITPKQLGILTKKEYLRSFIHHPYAALYASIYKRSLFQNSTFNFGLDLKIGEDVLTNIELASRVNKIINIDDVVYFYRNNTESVMNQKTRHPSYFERYYNTMEDLFRSSDELDNDCYDALHKHNYYAQLTAFYSPFIDFDETYYCKLHNMQKTFTNLETLNWQKKIFSLALYSKISTKVVKSAYYCIFHLKHTLSRKPFLDKEILY